MARNEATFAEALIRHRQMIGHVGHVRTYYESTVNCAIRSLTKYEVGIAYHMELDPVAFRRRVCLKPS